MAFDLNSPQPSLTLPTNIVNTTALQDTATQLVKGSVPENSQLNQPNNFQGNAKLFDNKPLTPTSGFSSGVIQEQKYNEWIHNVEMYLDNSGNFDGTRRYQINPGSILNLTINDNLNNWIVDGNMLLMYLPEESDFKFKSGTGQPSKTQIKGAEDNGALLQQYEFRGDGFDLLRIMIRPTNNTTGKTPLTINEKDPKWVLSYLFSIYDVEDLSEVPGVMGPASTALKCLRLSFRDVRYQMLKTTNLEYSTANSPDVVAGPPGMYNSSAQTPRALKTGNAILEIWNQALSKPDEQGQGAIEFTQIKGSNWDEGTSDIFYTSPAQYSAADDIDYIFAHHTGPSLASNAKVNDMCFMHTTRPGTPELLEPVCITPLKKFFDQAMNGNEPGELQLEQFCVTDHSSEKIDPSAVLPKTPSGGNGSNVNLKTFKYGQIMAYSLMDMSAEINSSSFISTPVYSVDIGRREFNMQFQNNDLLTVRKAIADEYIKSVFKQSTENEKLFLPVIHKTKKNNNIFPTYSLNGDNELVRQKNGFHKLLYTGLFQNTCICFKTFGLTLRESGSFISIDKNVGSRNTDFANKVFGQWFVVKVDHVFEAGSYMNIIYAVKLHRHDVRKAVFDNIL